MNRRAGLNLSSVGETVLKWAPEIGLAGCILAVIFVSLGSRGLIEPDEGRYAEMAREMLGSGDWLIPTLHGFAHFQKPPILCWCAALSIKLFGANEWAVRLPSALAGAGTAGLTFLIGRWLFNRRTGFAATLILITALEFFVLAKALTPDMLMTFFITLAMACFVRWTKSHSTGYWIWGFFAAMGAGFLTKGPMAFVIPGFAAFGWQVGQRRRASPVKIPWIRGALLSVGVGFSWFMIVAMRHPQLFHYFLRDELIGRYATTEHGRYQPPFFFIPVLLIGLLPWTFLLPSCFSWLLRRRPRLRCDAAGCFLAGATVVPIVILSFSGSKLLTYILPLYPSLALALGAWWEADASRRKLVWEGVALSLFLGFSGLCCVIAPHINPSFGRLVSPLLGAGLIILGLATGVTMMRWKANSAAVGISFAIASTAAWFLGLYRADEANDLLGRQASIRKLAADVTQGSAPDAMVFAYDVNTPGADFYLKRLLPVFVHEADSFLPLTPDQRSRLLQSPEDCLRLAPGQPLFGLVRSKRLSSDFNEKQWRVVDQAGAYTLVERRSDWARPLVGAKQDGEHQVASSGKPKKKDELFEPRAGSRAPAPSDRGVAAEKLASDAN